MPLLSRSNKTKTISKKSHRNRDRDNLHHRKGRCKSIDDDDEVPTMRKTWRKEERRKAFVCTIDEDHEFTTKRKTSKKVDYSDDDHAEDLPSKRSLSGCLEDLFQKKGPRREKALTIICDKFNIDYDKEFAEKNAITLLHRCLHCIKSDLKKGKCTKETFLASRIIGLLPLNVEYENSVTHEIFEDSIGILQSSISKFYQALKPDSDPSTIINLLDVLAVITFVGGKGAADTQRSMQIIWRFLREELVVASEPNTRVIISAISAWSFLLASIDKWNISSNAWKESIWYLGNLLMKSSQSALRIVAAETLAHIVEINVIEKFSVSALDTYDNLTCKSNGGSICKQITKTMMDQVKNVILEMSRSDLSEKDLIIDHHTLSTDIVAFLKRGCCPETSIQIGRDVLPISKWSQLIQVDFLKRFLGTPFVRYVEKNELFRDFYDFTPRVEQHQPELYISINEESGIRYIYQPEISPKNPHYKRICISSNSVLNKNKTRLMKKQRILSTAKNVGYYSASFGNEEC
ncbi:hypothetical protein AQUCO_03200011v1 [Aquilegia coerulea]|uniref:Interferon-related developmental regulator N-terminal domain-containing protein n=1 Tax=Aquilegia coerulea TaxID=218851 RepID=A0A2G5CZP9_AQUCA|nr:hypothetical protein AQUCO_03200011v1 [Aquilegia coerulea]